MTGVEPAQVTLPEPKSGASANSATSAYQLVKYTALTGGVSSS